MTLHGRPTSAELVESVREWMERDLFPSAEGRTRFHTRVAINVLAMVERELAEAGADEAAHEERLAALGVSDDAELAAAIRTGSLDDRFTELVDALTADVVARLAVANPRYG